MKRRRGLIVGIVVVVAVASLWFKLTHSPFPSDRTPEGAYARIALAVSERKMRDIFPYLETEAQWASYTIGEMRKKACARVRESYEEPEKSRLLALYGPEAEAPDGADVFQLLAGRRGFLARLAKDTSGVASVEREGERATVITARGTRYPFRRRENGIWGLTIFTAELLSESERATRDLGVVEASAKDYARAK